ncbi:HAD family hydrolase [Alkalimarinus alittae]|uniref:Haloacid dehalogenase-like hydrolase n=1 Tax=Alkalimarinus alittae TaxID=2961619 RepID=A0ABY6N2U6_9ALTE|nr:HAD family hydrolase [Alkalimarinus alittae]UZE96319.1 haloacid dehalogenase-like hydrolase [Alkalimarinus alittae]
MRTRLTRHVLVLLLSITIALPISAKAASDPLPSWKEGPTKATIIDFVKRVTDPKSDDFVPPSERIATTDNDGTLWSEQPLYFQGLWALDRIKALAKDHPEWTQQEPYKSAIAGDMKGMMAQGKGPLLKMLMAAHSDITAEEFASSVSDWLAKSHHPKTNMLYTDMVYQPMLELLDYLRANGFKVFIVSGGGIDFLRVFSEERYGVPPEQVVGTTADAKYELRDGIPTIVKEGNITLIDDKGGKPVGIYRHIGRRPIFAAGNSDGDMAMLQYTTMARNADDKTPTLGLIVHHTDAEREFAYDRKSSMGKLDKALDAAAEQKWLVVDMKGDWLKVFPKK